MKRENRLVLTIVLTVFFQLIAMVIWFQALLVWPEIDDFPPKTGATFVRLITVTVWIWVAIVLGVLVKRWYYILPLMGIPILKTLLSLDGFTILKTYSISQIAADEERLYHVMSTLSGLVVLSVLIVMLVVRLCILDRVSSDKGTGCQGDGSLDTLTHTQIPLGAIS